MEQTTSKNLTVPELGKRLQSINASFSTDCWTKLELLVLAHAHGLVNQNELDANVPQAHHVKKCYLRTIIEDEEARTKIERYVEVFSLFWIRAHYLFNLAIHRIADVPFARPQELPRVLLRWVPPNEEDDSPAQKIYKAFFEKKRPTALTHAFIPERYPSRRGTPLDLSIAGCWEAHKQDLAHLFPNGWTDVMSLSGWDTACSYASLTMRTTSHLYVRTQVVRCAKEYVKHLQIGVEDKLVSLLCKPLPKEKPDHIEEDIMDHIRMLRHVLGMEETGYLPRRAPELSVRLMDLYIYFAKNGFLKRNLMPLAKVNRKHAYIEERIVKAMFPHVFKGKRSKENPWPYMKALGLSMENFIKRQNNKRKLLKKWKGRKKEKVMKKWKRRGILKVPRNAVVKSALTDGVSLVLRVTSTPDPPSLSDLGLDEDLAQLPIPKKTNKKKRLIDEVEGSTFKSWRQEDRATPIFVGVDGGRAKILTATMDRDGSNKTMVFTRSEYYFKLGHKRRMKEVRKRVAESEALEAALDALKAAGKLKNVVEILHVQQEHFSVIREEYIKQPFHALNKMQGHRFKKSALAKAANKLLDVGKGSGRRTVVGYGDSVFPSGGKGEQSVPVKGIVMAIKESISRRKHQFGTTWNDQIVLVPIDEYRTTKVCCTCGGETEAPMVNKPDGTIKRSSRLRFCPGCTKNRDRDVQASRNILKILRAKYYGDERPVPFKRQKTSEVR